jgi:vacuole morphology and inheritance protein 14
LAADPDVNVRSAADVLDGLLKDIVTEGNQFDVELFVPMLSKRIYVTNTECRKFLVSWLIVLDSVPDIIEMVQYLHSFLDGLFVMLSDSSEEIRNVVGATLAEFLAQVKRKSSKVNFGNVVQIVLSHCSTTDPYSYITSQTAVTWVTDLITIGNTLVLPYGSQILNSILPCMAHSSKAVEELAKGANKRLLDLVTQTTESVDVKSFLGAVQSQLLNQRVPTRLAALRWVLTLYLRSSSELLGYIDDIFPALLKTLSDSSEEVVRLDLQVLAKLASNDIYFGRLMSSMIQLFRTDRKLLEHRGNLIIRQLSLSIKPEQIYRALSKILEPEEDAEFASTIIQSLNLILLTATELHELRSDLKNLSSDNSQDLFTCLYKSWCHSPTAVFSLCLLSQVYEHASDLVVKLYVHRCP